MDEHCCMRLVAGDYNREDKGELGPIYTGHGYTQKWAAFVIDLSKVDYKTVGHTDYK